MPDRAGDGGQELATDKAWLDTVSTEELRLITNKQREEVLDRSAGMCEAMTQRRNGVWSRCWSIPIEIHHMLTRARGGNILDQVGETHHLIALCPRCHRLCDGGEAYVGGLLIDGYVHWDSTRTNPVYIGTDPYLSDKYQEDRYARSS